MTLWGSGSLGFLSSDSKVWNGAQPRFLYHATEATSWPWDWLPLGHALILVQSDVVGREGPVVPAAGPVPWGWAHGGMV